MVWARRAISAWRPSGLSWRRSSVVRSVSRARLADIESSLRTAFSFRFRCLRTPAASSMKARRSSGRDSRISESLPCPTMTCISLPMPESLSSSCTSIKRQLLPLISYSLPPSRNIRRVIDTSEYSIGSELSELSIVTVTSARPSGGRDDVPAKMTSSILPPRSVFAPCSPITQDTASTTLDLPEPFGPTTQVMPGSKRRIVGEAKDLKPFSVRLLRYTTIQPTGAALLSRGRARLPRGETANRLARFRPVHIDVVHLTWSFAALQQIQQPLTVRPRPLRDHQHPAVWLVGGVAVQAQFPCPSAGPVPKADPLHVAVQPGG